MSDINSYNTGLVAAYVPNVWATGDTITAELLNHMEEGIENASSSDIFFVATIEYQFHTDQGAFIIDSATCDKTISELREARDSGRIIIVDWKWPLAEDAIQHDYSFGYWNYTGIFQSSKITPIFTLSEVNGMNVLSMSIDSTNNLVVKIDEVNLQT